MYSLIGYLVFCHQESPKRTDNIMALYRKALFCIKRIILMKITLQTRRLILCVSLEHTVIEEM